MEYRIEYDPVADVAYVKIKEGKTVDSTELNKDIIVDFNEKGEIIGLEILNFSRSNINLNEILIKGIESIASVLTT